MGLRYDDLPPAVVDRAKGVTLHGLASALIGSQTPDGRQAVKLITEEEAGVKNGATILVDGARVTKGGAAFANSEMAFAGGKWDTFRMLTHPGTSIIPCALIAAETTGASGQELITGLAAGYEVMERMAADFIPTVMARGFHPGPVFGIFGAAVAAAKMMRFTEDQVNSTIALCASLAGQQPRRGAQRRPRAARGRRRAQRHAGGRAGEGRATSAARRCSKATPASITRTPGNNRGSSPTASPATRRTSLDKITAALGKDWMFLETLYRIYSTAGYNIAHIDVTAKLCAGARHPRERYRPHRSGGELARDAVSEPGVPEPARGSGGGAGEHGVLLGVRRCDAGLSGGTRHSREADGSTTRPKCWS